MHKRTEGVTILALLALCLGFWNMVSQLFVVLWFPRMHSSFIIEQSYVAFKSLLEFFRLKINLPWMMLNIIYCLCAFETLRLRDYCRLILVIISFIFIFIPITSQLVSYYFFPDAPLTQILASGATIGYELTFPFSPSMIIYFFIVVYFTNSRVKALFS